MDCISSGQDPFNDGCAGLRVVKMLEAASESLKEERIARISMNAYNCIADDVKLGKNVRLSNFINLYGCEVGDDTKIGAFCGNSEECELSGKMLQDFPATHSYPVEALSSRTMYSLGMA